MSSVTENIDGSPVSFDEHSQTDGDILCYHACSPLYTGSPIARDAILAGKCGPRLYWATSPGSIGRADLTGCVGGPPCDINPGFLTTSVVGHGVAVG